GLRALAARAESEEDDSAEAIPMLVEGDASLAMLLFMAPKLESSLDALPGLLQLMRTSQAASLGNIPPYLRDELIARYLDGMLLCAALHRSGGWALVNRAFAAPPISTEQVLHPEKY